MKKAKIYEVEDQLNDTHNSSFRMLQEFRLTRNVAKELIITLQHMIAEGDSLEAMSKVLSYSANAIARIDTEWFNEREE